MKEKKKVIIYGVCYFLVFALLSAGMPILRDVIAGEPLFPAREQTEQQTEEHDVEQGKTDDTDESEILDEPDEPVTPDEPVVPDEEEEVFVETTDDPAKLAYTVRGDGKIIINGIGTYSGTLLKIPRVLNGHTIIAIMANAFNGNTTLHKVIISETVQSIGNYAFANCSLLQSVELPNNLTELPFGAFYYCTALTDVKFSSSNSTSNMTGIGYMAFYGCTALREINLPPQLTSISYEAFGGCSSLLSLTIPDSVIYLSADMCIDCKSLEKIVLPKNLKQIDASAIPSQTEAKLTVYCPISQEEWNRNVFVSTDREVSALDYSIFVFNYSGS